MNTRAGLAMLAVLFGMTACDRRPDSDEQWPVVRPATSDSEQDELLPPPEGVTPRVRPQPKSDKTLQLLAELCQQQQDTQKQLLLLEQNNARLLAMLEGQSKKVHSVDALAPELLKKIEAQTARAAELEQRVQQHEATIRNLQERVQLALSSPVPASPPLAPATPSAPVPAIAPVPEHSHARVEPASTPPAQPEALLPVSAAAQTPAAARAGADFSPHAQQLRSQVRAAYAKLLQDFPQSPEAADAYFGLAVMAEEDGNWAEAVLNYGQLLKHFPKSALGAEAHFNLARANAKQGKFDEARRLYLALADNYPRHKLVVPALLGAAECLAQKGEANEALREYRALQRSHAGTSFARQAQERMGALLLAAQRYPEAIAAYKAAAEGLRGPERTPVELQLAKAQLAGGDVNAAQQTLEALRPMAQRDALGWEVRWHLARVYEEQERALDAARAYRELADDFAQSADAPRARLRAAAAFLSSELAEHASDEAKKVLRGLDVLPEKTRMELEQEALFTLARASGAAGNDARAREYLAELRSRYPLGELAQRADLQEAEALAACGKPEDAISLLRQTMLRQPNSAAGYNALLRIADLQERSRNDVRGASIYAELANLTREDEKRAVFKLQRGALLFNLGRNDQARQLFKALIADTAVPKAVAAMALYQTAILDQTEGKLLDAIAGYERFIQASAGGNSVLGIDLTQQVEDARFKVSKLKLIHESRDQASAAKS